MSGKPDPPTTNAEWSRQIQKKVDAVDTQTSVRIGNWVLSEDPDTGNLIGSRSSGGSVIIAVAPDPSANPDETVTPTQPFIKVERQANQNAPRGSDQLVIWDTVASQTSDWGFSPTGTAISIPVAGIYEVKYHLAFLNIANIWSKASFYVNGQIVMAQEFTPSTQWRIAMYMSDYFSFSQGDVLTCAAFVTGSGTMDFGTSGTDPNVHTSLSLKMISKGGSSNG